jgi:hypothetical protein
VDLSRGHTSLLQALTRTSAPLSLFDPNAGIGGSEPRTSCYFRRMWYYYTSTVESTLNGARLRNNAGSTRGKPFAPGNAGRPRGSRNKATLAVEALLDGEAEAITRKAVEMALSGEHLPASPGPTRDLHSSEP